MDAVTASRRAVLASALSPALAHPNPATAAPASDARLLALAHAIRAASEDLEAICIAVSNAHGTPDAEIIDKEVGPAIDQQGALISKAATIPAEGALGLAVKGLFIALAVENWASIAEQELADSLREDVARLFPALAEIAS